MMHERLLRLLRPLTEASFGRQLGIAGIAAILAMGVSSALVSSWQGSRQVRATLEQQGLGLASGLAQQSQLALLTSTGDNAREAIGRAFSYPDILRVEILHPDGSVLVAQGEAPGLAPPPPAQAASAPYLEAETPAAWSFVAPVRTSATDASPFETKTATPEFLGYVRVTQGKATLEQLQRRLVLMVFSVGLGFSLLVLWGLRVLARNLMRPLGALSDVMVNAGAGAVRLRAPVSGPRDIARMAQVFNEMMQSIEERELELQHKNAQLARHAADLEERVGERTRSLQSANAELQGTLQTLQAAQKQLVENERLVSLGRLVAGVAHELNTPLGNALVCASTLEDQQRDMAATVHTGQVRKSALLAQLDNGIEASSLVRRNVERAADIVRSFKQLALDQTTEMRRDFLADQVIGDVLTTLRPMFKHTAFEIQTALAPGIEMDSYPGPLGQVITNVVQNALIHGFDGRSRGVLRLTCQVLENGMVQVVCSDDGNGMPPQVLERIFDAFFTTKFGQGGSGLGMQIVYTLVTGLLGGQVQVHSALGEGTRVEIVLPLHAPVPQHA